MNYSKIAFLNLVKNEKNWEDLDEDITKGNYLIRHFRGDLGIDCYAVMGLCENILSIHPTEGEALKRLNEHLTTPSNKLMAKEKKWLTVSTLASKDPYTIQLVKGSEYGVLYYAVMRGKKILSMHNNKQKAFENLDIRLNEDAIGYVDDDYC